MGLSSAQLSESELLADIEPVKVSSELENLVTQATNSETETVSESQAEATEPETEIMTAEDADIVAALGVTAVNKMLPVVFGAPVALDEAVQAELAKKASPLIEKYSDGENVPPWLKKYADEISFGLAVGCALFGCWRGAKMYKAEQAKLAAQPKPRVKVPAQEQAAE